MTSPTLLWFRRDLRVADHPALLAAAADNADVLGVFVADDTVLEPSGAPRRAFLAGCLAALSESMGGRLLIVHGRPESAIPRLARAVGATSVHVSADYGPYGRRRDERVATALRDNDIDLVATGSPYAVAPGRVRKADGTRYAVFTPYFRGWSDHGYRSP
ncbi:MAG TPA: deoxyribodipyrimidine photo-lyase, partial [Nakamurella sp.]